LTIGGHYLRAWSQDDRAQNPIAPDGSISILAAAARLTLGRFGHAMFAYSRVVAKHARSVGQVVEVLNTKGGPGLRDNYFGRDGDASGSLDIFGGQYNLSVGRLVSYPIPFNADGPDLVFSAFGIGALVQSEESVADDITKVKYGGEATYSPLSWLALSARYDRVMPNFDNDRFSFAVISPRIILHTDWTSTDQLVLQYSRWLNGALTTVRTGYPAQEDPTVVPDEHMVSLSANMWW
jgi:hypothetical protein